MCIAVFLWKAHPLYPFLLLLNRDEYHNRPTQPLGWWEGGQILGGRDELGGGTWLASSRNGRFAFLTNVRELEKLSDPMTRGDLPLRFLESNKSPKEFAEELVGEEDRYNGFNLVVADICCMSMVYVTNRPKGDGMSITEVSPGIHVLSNAKLDTPWPKALRLQQRFNELLDVYSEAELPMKEMSEKLMEDTTKDTETELPGIYSIEWEYHLSSIFIEAETPMGRYGTRSSSTVTVRASQEVTFYERYLENDLWKEQEISYLIEKDYTM